MIFFYIGFLLMQQHGIKLIKTNSLKEIETKKIEKLVPTDVEQEEKVSPPEKGTEHLETWWSTLTTS